MPDSPDVERADFEKLMLLLREYTEKLMSLSEEYAALRYRRIQTLAVTVVTLVTALSVAIGYFRIRADVGGIPADAIVPILTATIGAVGAIMFAWVGFATRSRFKYSYDTHQVAATVESLVKTASQYSEHARRLISERFEFDLRLAEAEAALRVYYEVFDRERLRKDRYFS
jgi:hypothetical protein